MHKCTEKLKYVCKLCIRKNSETRNPNCNHVLHFKLGKKFKNGIKKSSKILLPAAFYISFINSNNIFKLNRKCSYNVVDEIRT